MDAAILRATYYLLLGGLGLLMVYGFRLERRVRGPGVLIWVTLIAVFIIPAAISPLIDAHRHGARLGTFDFATSAFVFPGLFFAYGFTILFVLTRMVTIPKEEPWVPPLEGTTLAEVVRRDTPPRLIPAVVVLAGVALLMTLAARVSSGGLSFRGRADGGPIMPFATFAMVTAGAGMLLLWLTTKRSTALAVAVVFFVGFMLKPSRSSLLPAVAPFAMLLIYGGKGGWKAGLVLCGGGAAAFLLFAFLQIVRWFGTEVFTSPEAWRILGDRLITGQGEFQTHWSYYFTLERGHELDGYMQLGMVRRIMMLPIPTGLTGGLKPIDPNNELALACYPEWTGSEYFATLHPLVFGSAFIDMGWAGVFMGIAWALGLHGLMRLGASVSVPLRMLWLGPMCAFCVLMARGTVYSAVWLLVGGMVATSILYWVASHRVRVPRVHFTRVRPSEM